MDMVVELWANRRCVALLPKIDLYRHPTGLGLNAAFLIWNISIYKGK